MGGSISERVMRDAVIDKIRQYRPKSRIIHELNTNGTGSCRADLAAIGIEEILTFEIKSERDVLKRLTKQWDAFRDCSHKSFIVLDQKFFTTKTCTDSRKPFFVEPEDVKALKNCYDGNVWIYPEPKQDAYLFDYTWKIGPTHRFGNTFFQTPDTRAMLNLLWREELLTLCRNLNLTYVAKDNMKMLIERIILGITGRQIVVQVCAALRSRPFAVADEIC